MEVRGLEGSMGIRGAEESMGSGVMSMLNMHTCCFLSLMASFFKSAILSPAWIRPFCTSSTA